MIKFDKLDTFLSADINVHDQSSVKNRVLEFYLIADPVQALWVVACTPNISD